MMKTTRTLLGGCVLFALLGLADLALTAYLLRDRPGQFFESNPLARWWLDRWGWVGLIGFKAGLVLAVIATVLAVARWRPQTARRVLLFSCIATAAVLSYSGLLTALARAEVGVFRLPDDATIQAQARQIEDRFRQVYAYREVLDRVSAELAAGRCTLTRAVQELRATERARDPDWMKQLRRLYPNRSDHDCLAASVLQYTYGPEGWPSEMGPPADPPFLPGDPATD
jgi:hypothetical protein